MKAAQSPVEGVRTSHSLGFVVRCIQILAIWWLFAGAAVAQTGLIDNFASDSALNTALWTSVATDYLKSAALSGEGGRQCFSLANNFVKPNLSFGSTGMQMSGVNAWNQFTGIQSLNTFAPPFTFETTVTGTVANGNPFEIYFMSADGKQVFSMYGDVNPANVPYVGIKVGCQVIYATPNVNVAYTIDISATADGTFGVALRNGSTILTTQTFQLASGPPYGPFYLILGQGEGWPNTGKTENVAVWQSAKIVKTLTSPSLLLGAWLGQWPDLGSIRKFQSDSGHHLDIVNIFANWCDLLDSTLSTCKCPDKFCGQLRTSVTTVHDNGSIPMITWQPTQSPDGGLCDADISARLYDGYIQSFARDINSLRDKNGLPYPILIRPMHEMNLSSYSWGLSNPSCKNTASTLISAWQHIVTTVTKIASNAEFVWCINNTPLASLSSYYPGDQYVSHVAIDGYNWGNYPLHGYRWQTFDDVFSTAYAQLSSISSRPILIGEWASDENGGSKAQWIKNALDELSSGQYPRISGLVWFNEKKLESDGITHDWRIESTEAAQCAYACALSKCTCTCTSTTSSESPGIVRHAPIRGVIEPLRQ